MDRIDTATHAIVKELDKMRQEFDNIRLNGMIGEVFENDDWVEFEVADSIRNPNYTMVPFDFEERLAAAVLKAIDAN